MKFTNFASRYRELIVPAAILSATIMGAGMFSLPYLFNKAGFIAGIFYLALFGLVLAVTHFLYSEVIRATPGEHRFLGYTRIYLGWLGWIISVFTTGLGLVLIFTIFLAISASFINLIFQSLTSLQAALLFWAAVCMPLFLRIGRLAILESIAVSAVVLIAFGIFIISVLSPTHAPITLFNSALILLPYGAVLFAMYGRSAISSVMDYAAENNISRGGVRRAIILGTIVPAVVYLLFVFGALTLSKNISPDTVSSLIYLPKFITIAIACLGIFSLWESGVALSRESAGIFVYDLGLSGVLARFLIIILPLSLYFLGLSNFITLVGIVGGIFITLEGVMVVLMWQQAYGNRPLWSYGIIALFIGGAIYEILQII
jgi:amino acid permease